MLNLQVGDILKGIVGGTVITKKGGYVIQNVECVGNIGRKVKYKVSLEDRNRTLYGKQSGGCKTLDIELEFSKFVRHHGYEEDSEIRTYDTETEVTDLLREIKMELVAKLEEVSVTSRLVEMFNEI